jgi:hypothetical protein
MRISILVGSRLSRVEGVRGRFIQRSGRGEAQQVEDGGGGGPGVGPQRDGEVGDVVAMEQADHRSAQWPGPGAPSRCALRQASSPRTMSRGQCPRFSMCRQGLSIIWRNHCPDPGTKLARGLRGRMIPGDSTPPPSSCRFVPPSLNGPGVGRLVHRQPAPGEPAH